MSTKNQEYWRRRAKQNQKDWEQRCHETIEKRLSRYYAGALKAIKEDILQLYGTFAKESGIDFNEARRVLGSREFREWRMTIQEYLQRIAGGEVGLSRELRVLEARLRISPLEKLYSETLQELDKLGRNVDKSLRDFLSDAYTGNYRRNIFDLVKTGGLDVSIAKVDSHDVSRVLASRWSGKNFSKRVWNNTTLLSRNIRSVITNGVHRGLSVKQMSQMIEDKMHAGYSNTVSLVRTEMNFVNNQAHYDSMKDAGVEYYQFMAVLDNRTSQRCRALDGEVFLLEERDVGANYPPMHARCRSTVAPFIEGVSTSGKRVARDSKGRNIEIPAAMTYEDYESVYIRKEKSLSTWKKEHTEPKFESKVLANKKQVTTQTTNPIIAKSSVSDCKSFEELRNYWVTNYGVRINKSVDNLDFRAVNEATQGIERVLQEFPKASKYLKVIGAKYLKADAYMIAEYRGAITFNIPDYRDYYSVLDRLTLEAEEYYHPRNTKIYGAAAHEMGHILERALIDIKGGGVQAWNGNFRAKDIIRAAIGTVRQTPLGKNIITNESGLKIASFKTVKQLRLEISEYADAGGYGECLAEAVCDYVTNGENASVLSKEI